MKDLVKALEGLPWIVKLILTLIWGIYGNIYRLLRSLAASNLLGIVLSILLLICGGFFILWIIDIICILIGKDYWWFC